MNELVYFYMSVCLLPLCAQTTGPIDEIWCGDRLEDRNVFVEQ